MTTYRFTTTVSEDGTIKLPDEATLPGEEVVITVTSKQNSEESNGTIKAAEFLNKWSGFLKGVNVEDDRYSYLMEKHK